jgi:REP element-mobilizing transposase RayT
MRYRRNSLRLPGYDYTRDGLYFVTINVQGHECLFGEVKNNQIFLNSAGKMVNKWWLKLVEKFTHISLDAYIIMPDHFHGIVCIVGAKKGVCPDEKNEGADLCVCPEDCNTKAIMGAHTGAPIHRTGVSLSRVIQWFKTMTTNEYIQNVKQNEWNPFYEKLWQRGFYDHIIRSKHKLYAIRKYIKNNPSNWHNE